LAGCQTAAQFSPTELPAHLRARPAEDVHTIDLSRFSGPPVDSELIGRGDILKVSLAASLDADSVAEFNVRVGDNGIAVLPEIGQLQLAGLRLIDAEQQIVAACIHGGLYTRPQVTVTLEQQRLNRVTVVGGVRVAGVKELPRQYSYLLAAIDAAEGLSDDAGTRVEIHQPTGPTVMAGYAPNGPGPPGVAPAGYTAPGGPVQSVVLNLADATERGAAAHYLHDGAVVRVERRNPEPIQVLGLVRNPDQYEFPLNHEVRVLGAIAQAGGLASRLATDVLVLRKDPMGGESASIRVDLRKAKFHAEHNLPLAPGDIVSVEQTPATMIDDLITKLVRFGMSASVPLF
jgi:polysaccharide export outer membrane protein